MNKEFERLLGFSSASIVNSVPQIDAHISAVNSSLTRELADLLAERNGFYAFESALLVRPSHHTGSPLGLVQWNHEKLWRYAFQSNLVGVFFFAEDIFGMQFCIEQNGISSFDPETGDFEKISDTLHGWATCIVDDYRVRTGWPLGHEWQTVYGAIEPGQRLLPKQPFVLGGEYALKNLYKLNDVEGMLYRASIAIQLRDCPDGSTVVLKPENGDEPTDQS